MKRLDEIIQSDNNIHASIHADNVAQSTADVAGDFSSGAVFESENNTGFSDKFHKELSSIDIADNIHERIAPHYNKYTTTHLNTIEHYAHNEHDAHNSSMLNSYHWEKAKNPDYKPGGNISYNEEMNNQLKSFTKLMDTMVSRHKTPEDLTVYSGTKHDPRKIKKNGVVNHPAYLSTSLNPEVASGFAARNRQLDDKKRESHHHILQIHVPQGTSGAYIAHTGKALSWEKELILPRNTKLKHIRTETSKEYPDAFEASFSKPYKHIHHIHHMEVVS